MRAYSSLALLIALSSVNAAAQTQTPVDELSTFLTEKGLLSRIGEASNQVQAQASDLVVGAMGFLGVPYRRGGSTVDTGFDCSGFVKAMFEQTIGLVLPRNAAQQAAATQTIDRAELRPGDLVFFNTMRHAFSHVGIYIGNGKFIHSPKPGAEVRVEDMGLAYWARRFDGARRVSAEASAIKAP
ncbi:MAG: C40 family peptidase [Betaproteobacteria bacterium]